MDTFSFLGRTGLPAPWSLLHAARLGPDASVADFAALPDLSIESVRDPRTASDLR